MKNAILIASLFVLISACSTRVNNLDTPDAILAQMRADTDWIHELDSLAQIAIGPGAKCIDPVWHTFSYEGRTWFFNQDWGGVLEIPSEFIPEDDFWQAEFSFHGTRAWSPDSLMLISFYAGFQSVTNEESIKAAIAVLLEEGFSVLERSEDEKTFTIHARSAEGINYYGRYHFANEDGIEYAVSVQYSDEKSSEVQEVIEMAVRYPAGPGGICFKGMAL
jgi:hypothetical protein